jgi:hypothetical protein
MTESALHQAPEGISPRAIWLVAAGVVVLSAALVVVAWLLVVPPPAAARPVAAPSPLEHGLIDEADGGAALRATGERALEQYRWIDRKARTVRIPIDRAIDAAVADPRLIGARSPGVAGAAAGAASQLAAPSPVLPAEVRR